MATLEQYLTEQKIDPLRLSAVAGVRFFIVWNATHEKPVSSENAQKIRVALHRLTGKVYTGTLPILQDEHPPVKRVSLKQ